MHSDPRIKGSDVGEFQPFRFLLATISQHKKHNPEQQQQHRPAMSTGTPTITPLPSALSRRKTPLPRPPLRQLLIQAFVALLVTRLISPLLYYYDDYYYYYYRQNYYFLRQGRLQCPGKEDGLT
ncbi:predicted protein [Chaetomium globosum CBS 148.51]|uniref:Uncharacterized protein n=1 Tax=Chaetomium globosum (strain ATCC 6205 / CBS 148.51 / DSM 1962 / NBRC 6347 / NRRL 1970) TaxID=306901 RepID=Q2GSV4_CHAGB|nr:uncharacterized protein CHGG_08950 [Chaetomium globosum CBS 148.51]EAQ84936.1 predicted protein [Chaetomium globosum CBS 148.51]